MADDDTETVVKPEASTPPPVAKPDLPVGGSTTALDAVDPRKNDVLSGMLDVQTREMAKKQEIADRTEHVNRENQARAQKLLDAEGVGPDLLGKKWDAQAEAKKYAYDPIEAFGSFGSVLGIMASAFTHQPMATALDASAGAMTAIKQGKDQEYTRAYQAWKDNTELVIKRQNMIHQTYGDAIAKMSADANLGRAELESAMIRFGDEKKLVYLRAGMLPELTQIMESEAKATAAIEKANTEVLQNKEIARAHLELRGAHNELETVRKDAEQIPQMKAQAQQLLASKDPGMMTQGVQLMQQIATAEKKDKEAVAKVIKAQDNVQEVKESFAPPRYESDANIFARELRKVELEHPTWTRRQQIDEATKNTGRGGAGRNSEGAGFKNKALADIYAANMESGKYPDTLQGRAEARKNAIKQEADTHQEVISSKNQLDMKKRINDYTKNIADIDTGLDFLDTYKFGSGPFSALGRAAETMGDLLQVSDQTDRRLFEETVDRVKAMARTLLNESQGRALKEEEKLAIASVAGFSYGDTTEKVKASWEKLKQRYEESRQDYSDLLNHSWRDTTPGVSQGNTSAQPRTEAPKPSGGPKPWERGGSDWVASQGAKP